jgi:N-dimethylarginine dimethylaminohydrolase
MSAIALEVQHKASSQNTAGKFPGERFLMCPPRLYDVDYVINPWMEGNLHLASRELAAEQWQRLYEAVSRVAEVKLVEPQAGSPDMVFTANAGLVWGRQVAISSFYHPERQGEEPHFRKWFEANGYSVLEIARETPFEGEGDALFSESRDVLWAGFGPRTARSSHRTLHGAWQVDVVSLELVDARFYHLDTCFAPLAGGFAMYFPAAFSAQSQRQIESYYSAEKRIAVHEADAVRFACNAVNVDETIILPCIGGELTERLGSLGFEVVQLDLSEFMRAGGAAKCLVMKLEN